MLPDPCYQQSSRRWWYSTSSDQWNRVARHMPARAPSTAAYIDDNPTPVKRLAPGELPPMLGYEQYVHIRNVAFQNRIIRTAKVLNQHITAIIGATSVKVEPLSKLVLQTFKLRASDGTFRRHQRGARYRSYRTIECRRITSTIAPTQLFQEDCSAPPRP